MGKKGKYEGYRLSITVHKATYDRLNAFRIKHEDDGTMEEWEHFINRLLDDYEQLKGKGGKEHGH